MCVCVTGGTCRRGERVTLPVMDGSVGGADSLIVVISFPHPALFTLTVISGNISMAERWQGSRGAGGGRGVSISREKKRKRKSVRRANTNQRPRCKKVKERKGRRDDGGAGRQRRGSRHDRLKEHIKGNSCCLLTTLRGKKTSAVRSRRAAFGAPGVVTI